MARKRRKMQQCSSLGIVTAILTAAEKFARAHRQAEQDTSRSAKQALREAEQALHKVILATRWEDFEPTATGDK